MLLPVTSTFRFLSLTAVTVLASATLLPTPQARQAPPAGRQDGWSGSITVNRSGSTAQTLDGGARVTSTATQRITYTVRNDGSAGYTATHDETMTLTNQGYTATIHITGHGSGDTLAGVDFLDPDLLAMRVLGINKQWDLVAGGGEMDLHWDVPNEDAFQGGLLPFGLELRMEDSDDVRPFHGAETLVSAPSTAKTMTGTDPSSNYYSYFWPTMMNQTVTYNLTRGPVDPTPRAVIHGPACGCLDADHPETTSLKFIATASRSGGEFTEFVVKSSGKMPEISVNEGGATASLELVGSKDTGEVTLTIQHVKDGRRYDAPPFKVAFCTVEKLDLDGNEHDLAFDLGGELTVNARGKAWLNGQEVSTEIEWELEKMNSPTTLKPDPDPARGETIKFVYENLPERNSDFGEKKLTGGIKKGSCDCKKNETLRTFYIDEDDGHPGTERVSNWFYYWRQTQAMVQSARGILNYEKVVTDPQDGNVILALYDPAAEKIIIGDLTIMPDGCKGEVDRATHAPTGRQSKGIDCFANTVRHELQHRADAILWWGTPRGPYTGAGNLLDNLDLDNVPNAVERGMPGCSQFNKRSCTDRPFEEVSDAEVNACWVGWQWPENSVNKEDWSCGNVSKQWRGKKCP